MFPASFPITISPPVRLALPATTRSPNSPSTTAPAAVTDNWSASISKRDISLRSERTTLWPSTTTSPIKSFPTSESVISKPPADKSTPSLTMSDVPAFCEISPPAFNESPLTRKSPTTMPSRSSTSTLSPMILTLPPTSAKSFVLRSSVTSYPAASITKVPVTTILPALCSTAPFVVNNRSSTTMPRNCKPLMSVKTTLAAKSPT